MHASLVISHSSVKGLLEAERVNNFFDDTRGTVNASDLNNNMAAAKASARINGILSIDLSGSLLSRTFRSGLVVSSLEYGLSLLL